MQPRFETDLEDPEVQEFLDVVCEVILKEAGLEAAESGIIEATEAEEDQEKCEP